MGARRAQSAGIVVSLGQLSSVFSPRSSSEYSDGRVVRSWGWAGRRAEGAFSGASAGDATEHLSLELAPIPSDYADRNLCHRKWISITNGGQKTQGESSEPTALWGKRS